MPFPESPQLDMMCHVFFDEFGCIGETSGTRIPLKPYRKELIENIQSYAVMEGA
jgi:hypothetical protein